MKINRRNFLSFTSSLSLFSLFPKFANTKKINSLKYLILIELQGANDGLNTVIPYTSKKYYDLRPNLAIPKKDILTISKEMGLHFSLKGLSNLFEKGETKIIQNLGYPHPVLSHFRSIELWESGGDGKQKGRSGWLIDPLEVLEEKYSNELDAKAIHLDASGDIFKGGISGILGPSSLGLKTIKLENRDTTIPVDNLSNFGLLNEIIENRKSETGNLINLQNKIKKSKKFKNIGRGKLGKQMTNVCNLIEAGVNIPVFKVALGSFDTHESQFWRHRDLLRDLDESISDTCETLKKIGVWENTIIMTYSEFGRRAKENGSRGTDHGMAAPHFLIGGKINGGIDGKNPDLTKLNKNNLEYSIDYRSLYEFVLRKHFNLDKNPFEKYKSNLIT